MRSATAQRVSTAPVVAGHGSASSAGSPSSAGQLTVCSTTMQTVPPYSSITVITFMPSAPTRPKQHSTSSSYVVISRGAPRSFDGPRRPPERLPAPPPLSVLNDHTIDLAV